MDLAYIILSFVGGIVCPLAAFLNDMFFGNIHDTIFSDRTLEKLTVNNNSFFKKILPFKEIKGAVKPKYLYIRIIPLFIHIILFVLLVPIFLINLVFNLISNDVFGYIGIGLIIIFVLYNVLLAILARVFKL